MSLIEGFLFVFAVVGLISATTWYVTRRFAERSWWWRAILCILFAAAIAPTCFRFLGGFIIWPAVVVLSLIFQRDNLWAALIFGALPILATAGLIFAIWTIAIYRRHRQESHVA